MCGFRDMIEIMERERLEEGWKDWATAGAIAAAGIGAAADGVAHYATHRSAERPAAASGDMESDTTFQRDARILGRGRATERYNQRMGHKKMADQLKAAKKGSGTFRQGAMGGKVPDVGGDEGPSIGGMGGAIPKTSATSDDAADYL